MPGLKNGGIPGPFKSPQAAAGFGRSHGFGRIAQGSESDFRNLVSLRRTIVYMTLKFSLPCAINSLDAIRSNGSPLRTEHSTFRARWTPNVGRALT